jgi:DNA-binding winged helix-turn-helix (wHTH) protein/tetratricopeptide (TPR) repeat protein
MSAHVAAPLFVDGWRVDEPGQRLARGHEERSVEPRALQVLLALARTPGEVVTRDDLRREVWDGAAVSDDAVSVAVLRLRRALDDDSRAPRVLETVSGSGYRLAAAAVQRGPVTDGGGRRRDPVIRVGTVVHVRLQVVDPPTQAQAWQRWDDATADIVAHEAELLDGHAWRLPGGLILAFGAPFAQEDHVERGARCAHRVMARLDGTVVAGLATRVHVGAATGELVATTTVVPVSGAPVHQATELAHRAAPGELLATDAVLEALGVPSSDRGDARQLPHVSRSATSWGLRSARGLTPLAGRVPELSILDTFAATAAAGHGQVVVLVGEAGMGKSRLVHEQIDRLRTLGWSGHVGAASSADRHSPYLALRRLLLEVGPEPFADEAAWNAVMDPDAVGEAWPGLDPLVRQQRVADASLDALLASEGPRVLVIEDVHWADEATRTWLTLAADRIARRRCLLLVTARAQVSEAWGDRSNGHRLRVGPLFPDDAESMLRSLVGDDVDLRAWKERVLSKSGGNPLFLEECVRATADQPGHPLDLVAVPSSLRGLLAERIDSLSPDAQLVVDRAAVIGRTTSDATLRRVLEADDTSVTRGLDELTSHGILRSIPLREGPGWEFTHVLVQDAAYAGITDDVRRSIHSSVAAALAATPGGATPARVAAHLTEAGADAEAASAWLHAARLAAQAGAHSDALEHLRRATEASDKVIDPDARDRLLLQASLGAGTSAGQVDGPTAPRTRDAFRRAVTLADRVGTVGDRFQARWGAWYVVLHCGDLREAAELADALWSLVPELDDQAVIIEAHHVQWSGQLLMGRTADALGHALAAVGLYDPVAHHRLTHAYGGHDPGVCALNLAALALWLQGDDDESNRLSQRAIRLSEHLGHPYSRVEGCHAALTIAAAEGHPDVIAEHTATLYGLADSGSVPEAVRGYADGFTGARLHALGDDVGALAVLLPSAAVWREFWGPWCLPLDTVLAEALLAVGRVDDALVQLDEAAAIASASHAPWWDAELLRVRARALRARGRDDDACGLLAAALSAAQEAGADRLARRLRAEA